MNPSVLPTTEDVKVMEHPVPINELFKSNDFLFVYAGDKERWVLNRQFLCYKIPSLRQRIEAYPSQDIKFRQVEPPVFAMAVDWFFTEKLLCKNHHNQDDHFAILCALHVFADKFEITELSTASIDKIKTCLTHIAWKPSQTEIKYIFKETPPRSTLRTIVVRETARAFVRQSVPDFKQHKEDWADISTCNQEFHARFLLAIKSLGHAKTPRVNDGQQPVPRPRNRPLFNEVIDLTAEEG